MRLTKFNRQLRLPALGIMLVAVAWLTFAALRTRAASPTQACDPAAAAPTDLSSLAARATSDDAAVAKDAIGRLRAAGPAGLAALLEANSPAVQAHVGGGGIAVAAKADAAWPRVAAAIDAVAKQKDAYASGLYWYTDLNQAKQAAAASGKPILSLRLLGTLDTEYSCANSRFFRTALYANRAVSAALRERFVLHWQSVRPVPRITIDFGDGRVVERTITGNSIHYVLDADGNVIDALPGLYGPQAFLQKLADAEAVEKQAMALAASQRPDFLRRWHAGKADEVLRQWQADLQKAGVNVPVMAGAVSINNDREERDADSMNQPVSKMVMLPPTAVQAFPRAMSKAAVERPLVLAVAPNMDAAPSNGTNLNTAAATVNVRTYPVAPPSNATVVPTMAPTAQQAAPLAVGKFQVERPMVRALAVAPDAASLGAMSDDAVWAKVAALHAEDARLDAGSTALMADKNPPAAADAARLAVSKRKVETPLVRMVRSFERSIAEDTVRDEYLFHRQIHTWLASPPSSPTGTFASDLSALNEKVYAELFLTPSTDPWLGLVPPDTYTALPNGGVCTK